MEAKEIQRKEYYCTNERPLYMKPWILNRYWLGYIHVMGFYAIYLFATGQIPKSILIFSIIYARLTGVGVTAGAHRLWSHKSFKANLPLKLLLAFMQSAAMQYSVFKWARDHRIHHKYTETDADPHDARQGFWFSHIGWLFVEEKKEVKEKEATIDYSDLDSDPVVRNQAKYFFVWITFASFLVPMGIQYAIWPQLTFFQLLAVNCVWYMMNLHANLLINSLAHMQGPRPYDKDMYARENIFVKIFGNGEGYHNYHHVFPWDYKAAEMGYYLYNWSTLFIDFFAWVGWAWDLKTVPHEIVMSRVNRTGDGTHHLVSNSKKWENSSKGEEIKSWDDFEVDPHTTNTSWGWGDKETPEINVKLTQIIKRRFPTTITN